MIRSSGSVNISESSHAGRIREVNGAGLETTRSFSSTLREYAPWAGSRNSAFARGLFEPWNFYKAINGLWSNLHESLCTGFVASGLCYSGLSGIGRTSGDGTGSGRGSDCEFEYGSAARIGTRPGRVDQKGSGLKNAGLFLGSSPLYF